MVTARSAGDPRVLSWENLRRLVEAGVPATEPIQGSPPLEIFVEAAGSRIGLLAPVERVEAPPSTRYADVRIRLVEVHGRPHVEISTASRALYHEFHALIAVTADLIQLEGSSPLTAISESLARWRQLLATSEGLTAEERLGLVGELWVLRRLVRAHGTQALDAWVGPRGEPHDVRLSETEIEVKTTRSARRVHIINSLEQLTPSLGCRLFIMSVQMAPAGAEEDAISIVGLVGELEELLHHDVARLDLFRYLLREQVGYRPDADGQLVEEQLVLRSPPHLVPVDDSCPALTRDLLDPLGDRAQRIDGVRYTVDLEGLGVEDGEPTFLNVVP